MELKSIILSLPSLYFFIFITGCVDDYNIGKKLENEYSPKVVLNCLLCPDSVIKVEMCWSKTHNQPGEFPVVESFSGEITEDGIVIMEFRGSGGVYRSDIAPKAGREYAIRCEVPGYGEVTATTRIPEAPRFTARYIETRDRKFHHFTITEISLPEKCRAVWFNNYREYDYSGMDDIGSFYAINTFFDQVNSVNDGDEAAAKGSNIEFEDFIRIPYKNIPSSLPASFSVWGYPRYSVYPTDYPDQWYEWSQEEQWEWFDANTLIDFLESIHIQAIAPSDDYDQYCKSVYRQQYYLYIPDVPWFNETVQVYTNINNGLGIFAGYSTSVFTQRLEIDMEEEW